MATVISKDEAFAHLSDVFERAMGGEEIEIEQGGQTMVKLVPVPAEQIFRRQFGTLGPISDEEAEEAVRSLPKEDWGDIGDDD